VTDVPYIENLVAVLTAAGERTVVRHEGREVSGRALLDAVYRHARVLDGLGIGRGDLVAIYAADRPESLVVRYATHLLGAASVYLSAPPDAAVRARMLVDFAPRLVVVEPGTAALVPETDVPLAAVGGPVPGVPHRLDEAAAALPADPVPSAARPDDLAVVVSSGGTTGVPKGSVRDFTAWTVAVRTAPRPERRQLADGNLAYLTQILVDQTLLGGGTVVLQEGIEPAMTLATVEAERITDLFLVEPQLFELMDHPDVERRDLSSLRTLTHIGANAAPVLRRRARERLGPVIAHTYGASEMGIVSALPPAEHDLDRPDRFTCAGHIVPGVEVCFRDDAGALAPSGGLMEVRSPAMAAGYRHRPVEEAEHFVDGWYRTGDLGRLDDEGFLHVLGRAADCEVVDGVLVTPVGLQDTLCRLPEVRYAVVVPELERGRRVIAVVAWPGHGVDPASCVAAVRREHGEHVADSLVVVEVERVPLTEQGKPDRTALRLLGETAGSSLARP
jgi:fatty-acyl-CoA synthase